MWTPILSLLITNSHVSFFHMVVVPWIKRWSGLCSCLLTLEWLCDPSRDLQSWRQVGHWTAIVMAGQKQLCGDDCELQAVLLINLFHQCTCHAHECILVGVDLGRYIEFRRLDVTPLGADLQCVFVSLPGWPCFLCPCTSSPKNSSFGMHSLPIQMMWPDQWSWAFSSITLMEADLAQSSTLRLVILSCHQMPQMKQCSHRELLQLLDVIEVENPELTAIEQWCYGNSSVDYQLCGSGTHCGVWAPCCGVFQELFLPCWSLQRFPYQVVHHWDHASKVF